MRQEQTEHIPDTLWDFVDAVLVINLDHRTDRWEQFLKSTEGMIPAEKLHRLPAVLGKNLAGFGDKPWFRGGRRDAAWAARAGCTLSHRRAMETLIQSKWNTVLILEDDIEFVPEFNQLENTLVRTLTSPENAWDVCYLGFTDPWGPFRETGRVDETYAFYQMFGCLTTHAYLITHDSARHILSRLPDESTIWSWLSTHRAIDRWYLRNMGLQLNVTCISPSVINQYADFSDIMQREADLAEFAKHVTFIAPDRVSPTSFKWKYLLQKWRSYPLRFSDRIRGLIKKRRGF